jgi:hypothetical protein
MRWPGEWSDPSALDVVRNSPVNLLLADRDFPLISEMQRLGITVLESPPSDVTVIKGEWPGVRSSMNPGSRAGPTGIPWVDSNGWQVRLARPPAWVTAALPQQTILGPANYLLALADAAAYGGHWLLDLDPNLRSRITARDPSAMETWSRLAAAMRFFAAHRAWTAWQPLAVVAFVSDFAGGNEFTSGELLNLTARLNQPYRILRKSEPVSLAGLKAVIYPDAEPPAPGLRRQLIEFVQSGGLLIAGDKSGISEGTPAPADHPRYTVRALGKGRIAIGDLSDPYQAASDAQILLSHRHDLVRFWNGASLGSYLTAAPDGKAALLQVINYSGRPGMDPVTARVAGNYREARIHSLDGAAPKPLQSVQQKEGIEVHLPPIPVYAAIELI